MNIADQIGFEGVLDMEMSDNLRPIIRALVERLEAYRVRQTSQLRKEPTVFYANPDVDTEAISGFKAGDLAIWVDSTGTSQFRVLV